MTRLPACNSRLLPRTTEVAERIGGASPTARLFDEAGAPLAEVVTLKSKMPVERGRRR